MQSSLRVVTALFSTLAATSSAVHIESGQAGPSPSLGARMTNLNGEAFDLNKPGEHLLWRVPRNKSSPALLDVHGNFSYSDRVTCALQLLTVTLRGKWFGDKVLKVSVTSGFAVKVSSTGTAKSAAFAGPWHPVGNFSVQREGREALPENIDVLAKVNNTRVHVRVGAKGAEHQPAVSISQNPEHKALDMTVLDIKWFNTKEFAGLLGTEKHDESLEIPSAECAAQRGKLRLRAQQRSSTVNASWNASA